MLKVGDKIRWHIRPEVHKDHGGYTETEEQQLELLKLMAAKHGYDLRKK